MLRLRASKWPKSGFKVVPFEKFSIFKNAKKYYLDFTVLAENCAAERTLSACYRAKFSAQKIKFKRLYGRFEFFTRF